MTYDPLMDAFDAFNLLCTLVWSLYLLPNLGHFSPFDMSLNFSFALPTFQEYNTDFEVHIYIYIYIYIC